MCNYKEAERRLQPLPLVISYDGQQIDVVKLSYERPVIAVRFLGSLCSHCMQQIVELNKQAAVLKSHGITVIAFSNNPPQKCAEVSSTYGIDTTVVKICSDSDNMASTALGTTITEKDGTVTELHGFVIVDKGLVVYEHYSTSPLMSFHSVIDKITKRRP